jgi:hypothetical protein
LKYSKQKTPQSVAKESRMNIKAFGCITSGFGLLGIIGVYGMLAWANTPVVYKAAYSNDCVAVWTAQGIFACDSETIPRKHETQVVMQGTTFDDVYYSLNH